jgi:hypothetical protein
LFQCSSAFQHSNTNQTKPRDGKGRMDWPVSTNKALQ